MDHLFLFSCCNLVMNVEEGGGWGGGGYHAPIAIEEGGWRSRDVPQFPSQPQVEPMSQEPPESQTYSASLLGLFRLRCRHWQRSFHSSGVAGPHAAAAALTSATHLISKSALLCFSGEKMGVAAVLCIWGVSPALGEAEQIFMSISSLGRPSPLVMRSSTHLAHACGQQGELE